MLAAIPSFRFALYHLEEHLVLQEQFLEQLRWAGVEN
jgi:hypothetical protein